MSSRDGTGPRERAVGAAPRGPVDVAPDGPTRTQVSFSGTAPRRSAIGLLETVDAEAASRPDPFAPGVVVNGRYTLDALVGAGGMGVVYRARDALHPERDLAVKTVLDGGARRSRISMFKSEFRMLAQLSHPNIARAYDLEPVHGPLASDPAGSDLYLFTMDFVPGSDALAATERASTDDVIRIVVEICRALSYVHSRKLVHFDLKPSNVLVTSDGTARVLDFGIAGAGRDDRGGLRGTPHYMAPELTSDASDVDHRADLYALGIMAYELLLRRLPFEGKSVIEIVEAHHFKELPLGEAELPPWLADVLRRLCEKEPDRRYRSANLVIEDINRRGGYGFELETRETRESYVLSSRFVGRRSEQEALWAFIRARTSGASAAPITLVGGQSGVGKSRLMRELRRLCQLHRVPFVEADCHETGRRDLDPFVRALSFAMPLARSVDTSEWLSGVAPHLAKLAPALFPGVPEYATHPDPEVERDRILGSLATFFIALSERTGFALYLNDLQWAGPDTIAVCRRIAAACREKGAAPRLALLGTFRDDEVEGRPLAHLLDAIREPDAVLALEPLPPDETGVVVESMLGSDGLPPRFMRLVADATAGNPFFIQELMRALIERGDVSLERGRWVARADIEELPILDRIDQVFVRRLGLLAPGPRRVLEAAAVHGKPIDVDVLQHACETAGESFYVCLAVLRERSMLRSGWSGEMTVALAHDRMRAAVIEALPEAERRVIHARLAEALDAPTDAGEGHLFDVAAHWAAAGPSATAPARRAHAVARLREAAKSARTATQYAASRRFLDAALLLTSAEPAEAHLAPELRAELLNVHYLISHEAGESAYAALAASDLPMAEIADARSTRGLAMLTRGRYREAYEWLIDELDAIGYRVPKRPGMLRMLFEFVRTRRAVLRIGPTRIAALPEAVDARLHVALRLTESCGHAATFVGPAELGTLTSMVVRWGLERGVTSTFCSPIMAFGVLEHMVLGSHRTAYDIARAGSALADRFGNVGQSAVIHGWVGCFTAIWCVPLRDALSQIERGFELVSARGLVHLAERLVNVLLTVHVWQATSAGQWLDLARAHEALMASAGGLHTVVEVRAIEMMIRELCDEPGAWLAIGPGTTDESVDELADGDPIALGLVWCCRAARHAAFERWAEAADAAEQATRYGRASSVRQFFTAQAEFLWFVATARAGRLRWPYLRHRRALRRWRALAASCEETFGPMLELTAAELDRARGKRAGLESRYRRAGEGAVAAGHVLTAALAYQLGAAFHREAGDAMEAARSLAVAEELYRAWGATRVARFLSDRAREQVLGESSAGSSA